MYINNYESKRGVLGNDVSPGALDDTPQTLGNSLPVEANSGVNLHGSMSEETQAASVVGSGAVAVTTTTEVKSASKIIFEAVYAFAANGDRNMTNLVPGEKCIVIRKGKRGWWLVSKLLFRDDKGFVPSTYLKPCDEVYYVKDVPGAIPSVLKASSTPAVDGGAPAAGKSDDAEVSGIQSEVTSSSKAVTTTEPKPSRAVKSNSTTRLISTAKRANQLVKTKSKPSRVTKTGSTKRTIAAGNSRVANSLVHTPEVQRISLAISSMAATPSAENRDSLARAIENVFAGTTTSGVSPPPPPPPTSRRAQAALAPQRSSRMPDKSSLGRAKRAVERGHAKPRKNTRVSGANNKGKNKTVPYRWKGARIPPADPNPPKRAARMESLKANANVIVPIVSKKQNAPDSSVSSEENRRLAVAEKRKEAIMSTDRVHGLVPRGSAKVLNHAFYWSKPARQKICREIKGSRWTMMLWVRRYRQETTTCLGNVARPT